MHTYIIAKDSKKSIQLYKNVLACKSIGETRDIKGEWFDKMAGIKYINYETKLIILMVDIIKGIIYNKETYQHGSELSRYLTKVNYKLSGS